jgi:hypothetical protein
VLIWSGIFFDDPAAAFANLTKALRRGAGSGVTMPGAAWLVTGQAV